MIVLALVPFAVAILVVASAPAAARSLSGRAAAITVTALALVVAVSTGLVLCAIACLALAHTAAVARLGDWSATSVASRDPFPTAVAVACAVLAVGLLASGTIRTTLVVVRLVHDFRLSAALRDAPGDLVVVDHGGAFALPGRPGRTVVSRGLLRELDARERRALLAHERSHIRHHHYVYVQLTHIAVAANPLLYRLVPAVRLAVERWADTDAASAVGDGRTVATALARAGLAGAGAIPRTALAVATTQVQTRIGELMGPARSRSPWPSIVTLTLLAVAASASATAVGVGAHSAVEWAQAVWVRTA